MGISKTASGLQLVTLLILFSAAGCASSPAVSDDPSRLLHDEAFPRSGDYVIESPEEIFSLDAQIRKHLDRRIRSVSDVNKRGKALLDEIFTQAALNLSYDRGANTTATETFHGQAANCLSLSILAYAIADYAGFEASFHEVDIPEYWERHSSYKVLSRHVNVRFKPAAGNASLMIIQPEVEVDFQRLSGAHRLPTRHIPQSRVIAMFYNNKGIDALLAEQYDLAYAYLKAALMQDATLAMAQANLGLLYGRKGHLAWAEGSLRQAIAIDGNNTASAENLATLLQMTGRQAEAEKLLAMIETRRQGNPYYVHMQGQQAYDTGDWREAIRLFRKAIALKPDMDQFHFDLAKAYSAVGDIEQAKGYLRRAEQHADSDELKEKYHGKLSALSEM